MKNFQLSVFIEHFPPGISSCSFVALCRVNLSAYLSVIKNMPCAKYFLIYNVVVLFLKVWLSAWEANTGSCDQGATPVFLAWAAQRHTSTAKYFVYIFAHVFQYFMSFYDGRGGFVLGWSRPLVTRRRFYNISYPELSMKRKRPKRLHSKGERFKRNYKEFYMPIVYLIKHRF
jgi:hypothetical protein